ncbi:MAG: enoyl-CoA hydratase [Acidimicrobiia bacterium]|nr:enoyl-CoA hydratase [Acidimicrobiia bacterium]NNF63295.1 enoyl-CoA hydratase [Acidimicrobiia bacterium]
MDHEHITVAVAGPKTTITLNRPERRNAMSHELMSQVISALTQLDEKCRIVVIAANGPAFSAGHDLSEMVDRPAEFYDDLFGVCTQMMQLIHRIPQPVIAKVQGVATAAGCQLVAACDLAIAADTSFFATPGVKIGLFCTTPLVPVSRAVGRKRALHMLLTGEPIDAARAVEWGLINRAVPAEELDAAVDELADQILQFSADTIGIGKGAFYAQAELHEDDAYEVAQPIMAGNASTEDAQEGMSAFLEKRAPTWASN